MSNVSALFAGLCFAAGALAQTSPTTPSGGSPATRPSTTNQAATADKADKAAAAVAKADRDFLRQAAQNGLAEVEASKMAQQKATNAEVKSFAAKMVADHTKANEELKQLAGSKGVTLPTEPSLAQRAKLKMLETADGEKFDKRYSENFGVEAHEDTVKLFRKAASDAKDADVKAFAQKTLASLQEHLTTAKTVHSHVEPSATGKRDKGAADDRPATARSERTDRSTEKAKQ